jgi:hypothetical protein
MTAKDTAKVKGDGPSPKELERLNAALRAAEVAKTVAGLGPTRPAETYGKIRDERFKDNRITSAP